MKQFVHINIRKEHAELIDLLERMKSTANDDFYYNDEMTQRVNGDNRGVGLDNYIYAIFTSEKDELFYANVFISINGDELKLLNITSNDHRYSELGVLRYNLIVNNFFHHFMARCLDASYNGCISMTGENVMMADVVGEDTYKALHAWESLCNKAAPTSNGYDEDRWFEFVIRLHNSGKVLNPSDFGQWLSEDCRWPTFYNNVISDLEIKLEYSLSLLKYYGRLSRS